MPPVIAFNAKVPKTDITVSPFFLQNLQRRASKVKAVELAGCNWVHVDVVDGHFMPNIIIGLLMVDVLQSVTNCYIYFCQIRLFIIQNIICKVQE